MPSKKKNLKKTRILESRKWNEYYSRNRNGPFVHKSSRKTYFAKNKEIFGIGI